MDLIFRRVSPETGGASHRSIEPQWTVAGAVERLAIEAGEKGGKYEDILFPVQE